MSLDEFVEEVRRTPRDWLVTSNGLLRRNGDQHAENPITAVGHMLGLRKPSADQFLVLEAELEVAPALAIDQDDAFEPASASDRIPGSTPTRLSSGMSSGRNSCGNPQPTTRTAVPSAQLALFDPRELAAAVTERHGIAAPWDGAA